MPHTRCLAVLVAFVLTAWPTVARAQKPSVDSVLRRLEQLERRVSALEAQLVGGTTGGATVRAVANWRDLQSWRRLRRGMSMNEVRSLLGEPEHVSVFAGALTNWTWDGGYGSVVFDSRDKLESWTEPRS